jgi:hypothetical protein
MILQHDDDSGNDGIQYALVWKIFDCKLPGYMTSRLMMMVGKVAFVYEFH